MKILLSLIAIVILAAGAWFSYDVKTEFTQLKADRLELAENNSRREDTIEKAQEEAVIAEEVRDAAQVKLSETEAELRTQEDNLALVLREKETWEDKISVQEGQIEGSKTLIATVRQEFSGLNVEIDEIPTLIKGLEDGVKDQAIKLEELAVLTESTNARVSVAAEELKGLEKRISDRAERIKGNSLEGFVTAVNHDWGIAVLNIPAKMPVDNNTRLMVRRGSSYVGKLKISSIEGSKIITDIDYKSMNKGIVIQPGDTVFLAKPVTN